MATKKNSENSEIVAYLDLITTRLDLIVNLLLDIMSDERFTNQREFNAKLTRLDSTRRFPIKPFDAGRIFGRPSRDVSSRRKEIVAKSKRAKKQKLQKEEKREQTS
ncbi:MAG: hypothetical protein B6D41_18580 [Chloroflexi bacterium UTCFX4]|jgi:hypothetical protein|nr:MAG: hypothetical protein B6D41_18580 [Chloroflexi bacterium UTCFX4]